MDDHHIPEIQFPRIGRTEAPPGSRHANPGLRDLRVMDRGCGCIAIPDSGIGASRTGGVCGSQSRTPGFACREPGGVSVRPISRNWIFEMWWSSIWCVDSWAKRLQTVRFVWAMSRVSRCGKGKSRTPPCPGFNPGRDFTKAADSAPPPSALSEAYLRRPTASFGKGGTIVGLWTGRPSGLRKSRCICSCLNIP